MSEATPNYEESKAPEDNILYWFNELDEAKERDKGFIKNGRRILEIYECDDEKKVPFNILFSNVDTLLPALYSDTPRPVVQRRFKDADPLGKASSEAAIRVLEFFLDTNIDGSETVNESLLAVTFDALTVGRGISLIKYDAEISESEPESVMSEAADINEPNLEKQGEYICSESKDWDKVLFGYARKWSHIPWIAFEETIDKTEAVRLFGDEIAAKIKFLKDSDIDKDDNAKADDAHQGGRRTATIYQIWDKSGGKKLRYVSKHYKDDFLKVDDDPLELTGFYPIPRPLQLIEKTSSLTPIAPYLVYENQAKELNEITRRISRLTRAIKAKGVYDSELGSDIANLMGGDDNTLIPADKSALLATEKGFQNAIWFMPIQEMVTVLQELYSAREQCKQVIYEITGISDIIRGSTNAAETATAQSIKSQWGTMRLKRNQLEVQRYARDILRIALEIAAAKFSEETWVSMTGLPFATEQDIQQAQMVMQAAQRYGQQPPPQFQPILDQAQQTLQKPQWSQILALLKNDLQRAYRIDIETNSTVMSEATEDKQNMNEALTALSSFIGEALPVVQEGLLPFDGFKEILLKICRQFQFGDELENILSEMQQPPPPQQPVDNSAQEAQAKAQSEQMAIQAKQQSEQTAQQADIQKSQAANQLEIHKMEAQRIIEQGKAETQLRIEQMRIESAEKIAEFEAQLDAQTKIEIIRLQNECEMKQTKMSVLKDLSDAGEMPTDTLQEERHNQMMEAQKEHMSTIMELFKQPYNITLPDGRTVTVN